MTKVICNSCGLEQELTANLCWCYKCKGALRVKGGVDASAPASISKIKKAISNDAILCRNRVAEDLFARMLVEGLKDGSILKTTETDTHESNMKEMATVSLMAADIFVKTLEEHKPL